MKKLITSALMRAYSTASPHMRELGFELIEVEAGVAVGRIVYRPEFVGDPRTGVIHGGVVTSLLDSVGGAAVIAKLRRPIPLATLDLRIDYLRPSVPEQQLTARVECYKATRNVAFTRGFAFDGDPADPVASMAASYMLRTQTSRRAG